MYRVILCSLCSVCFCASAMTQSYDALASYMPGASSVSNLVATHGPTVVTGAWHSLRFASTYAYHGAQVASYAWGVLPPHWKMCVCVWIGVHGVPFIWSGISKSLGGLFGCFGEDHNSKKNDHIIHQNTQIIQFLRYVMQQIAHVIEQGNLILNNLNSLNHEVAELHAKQHEMQSRVSNLEQSTLHVYSVMNGVTCRAERAAFAFAQAMRSYTPRSSYQENAIQELSQQFDNYGGALEKEVELQRWYMAKLKARHNPSGQRSSVGDGSLYHMFKGGHSTQSSTCHLPPQSFTLPGRIPGAGNHSSSLVSQYMKSANFFKRMPIK